MVRQVKYVARGEVVLLSAGLGSRMSQVEVKAKTCGLERVGEVTIRFGREDCDVLWTSGPWTEQTIPGCSLHRKISDLLVIFV